MSSFLGVALLDSIEFEEEISQQLNLEWSADRILKPRD
jgi:hypothetical protein